MIAPSASGPNESAADGSSGRGHQAVAGATKPQLLNMWLEPRRNLLAALAGGSGLGVWQIVEDWKIHNIRGVDVAIGPIVAVLSAAAFIIGEWRLNDQIAAGEAAAASVRELENARTDLETRLDRTGKTLEDMLVDQLRLIATRLTLTYQDRITLYKVDGDLLRCLSRWSARPDLRIRGRATIPASQGSAGRALKRTKHQATLPDPETHPGWWQEQAKMGVPNEVAARLRMRTRHYLSLAVQDRRGDHIGVIVFESEGTPRGRLTEVSRLWLGEKGEGIRVAELVRSWEAWTEAVGRTP